MGCLINFFWNGEERRLRLLWRLIFQLVLMSIILLPIQLILFSLNFDTPRLEFQLINIMVLFLSIVGSVFVTGRFIDKRQWTSFGLRFSRRWLHQFIFGFLLGALLMGAIFAIELALGWVEITAWFNVGTSQPPIGLAFIIPFIFYFLVGIHEELWVRGYQMVNIAEGTNFTRLGPRTAMMIAYLATSFFFGILHAANPNATLISTLALIGAGLFLGLGFVLTGELAIPIGLHISWNFFQGNVFGFPVSGTDVLGGSLISISQHGPTIVTGGAFGPEAGLIGIGAIFAGTIATILYVRLSTGSATIQQEVAQLTPPPNRNSELEVSSS